MKKILLLVLSLVMVIGLAGVVGTSIARADDPDDKSCLYCEGDSPEAGTKDATATGVIGSGPGYIIMDVDCWHSGHCDLCDEYADYRCTDGGYGPIYPCSFSDLVPPGNKVYKIEAVYNGASHEDGMISVYVNGTLIGSAFQGGSPSECGDCDPVTVTSASYPGGFPGYISGGTNSLSIETGGKSCVSDVHLKLYYEPDPLYPILQGLTALEAKADALEVKADLHDQNLNYRADEIEIVLYSLEAKADALEGKADALEAKIDKLATAVMSQRIDLQVIELKEKARYLLSTTVAGVPVEVDLVEVYASEAKANEPVSFTSVPAEVSFPKTGVVEVTIDLSGLEDAKVLEFSVEKDTNSGTILIHK